MPFYRIPRFCVLLFVGLSLAFTATSDADLVIRFQNVGSNVEMTYEGTLDFSNYSLNNTTQAAVNRIRNTGSPDIFQFIGGANTVKNVGNLGIAITNGDFVNTSHSATVSGDFSDLFLTGSLLRLERTDFSGSFYTPKGTATFAGNNIESMFSPIYDAGTGTFNEPTFTLTDTNAVDGVGSTQTINLAFGPAVPEPSSAALIAIVGIAPFLRRRRKACPSN